LILLALFQSRLHERSNYLGQVIQSQRKRLPARAQAEPESGDERRAELEHIRLAEQALVAVREAEERLGRGSYGQCDACHEAIAWDELLESPEKTTCLGCSTLDRIWLKA
jgi:RNA polymerase-binding transcription factor DksA